MMLDRLLRWLRIRREPEWWRVTGKSNDLCVDHDVAKLWQAERLADVLEAEGFTVKIESMP